MALSTLKGVYPYNGLDEYMELTPVRVYMSGKKNAGVFALVSAGDLGKVIGYRWYIWDSYAMSQRDGPGAMHVFVMGDRPVDVPEDWVIDHANRNKLDNRPENLQRMTVKEHFKEHKHRKWTKCPVCGKAFNARAGQCAALVFF